MVAHATKNNSRGKKMKTIDEDYHNEELQMKGETIMPDQGIVFNGS